jgi:uncharacterized protein
MQNRIEILREYIVHIMFSAKFDKRERFAYFDHMSSVSQFCALIALKRGENVELATMAGLLHDIHTYETLNSESHAKKGAVLAREILTELNVTTDDETDIICSAIHNHSSKKGRHPSFDEVLVDADVLQHGLYNYTLPLFDKDKERFERLRVEFGL